MHAHAALAAGFVDKILTLPGWLVIALVFLVPALEASAFVGFVFPGEVAVILGGVAAWRGTVPLWAVITAAVAGAVIGDSAGYLIGRRWGEGLLHGTIGRLPVIRRRLDRHLESARAYVRRRRGSAVFFGRFTAALRVLVPGLAGMSQVEYPVFLAYNVAGGVLWGTGMAVLGYLAGASYKHVEKIAGRAGLGLLALIVVGLVASRLLRRYADRPRLQAAGDRLAATPPLAWFRRRFPRQVVWLRRRLEARDPRGFWLTFTVAAGALAGWAFGAITQDVVAPDELALRDPRVAGWAATHRTGWLTATAKVAAWPGSVIVIVALAAVTFVFLAVRRRWHQAMMLGLAAVGSVSLSIMAQQLVGRSRPPAALSIGHYAGPSFPSGQATTAIACFGMLAVILAAGRPPRTQAVIWACAAAATVLAGAAQIYLGANWLTDVLGGWALGAMWIAIVLTAEPLITRPGGWPVTTRRPNTGPQPIRTRHPGTGTRRRGDCAPPRRLVILSRPDSGALAGEAGHAEPGREERDVHVQSRRSMA
ncbi:MAG TPA: bifunctional DedA family/phosphatase PAP2 family protein [Streptosporangiaceae bacterium]|nr:bifunctional DedA family/phosphatase PAP2 family protein [Streptosporangiaceae bacterium]